MNTNELKIMVPGSQVSEDIFKLVPASQLSLSDEFLNYTPSECDVEDFIKEVKKVIEAGVSDFWRPTIDPSFDDNGGICYRRGMNPAREKNYNWWFENAKRFCPERNSRIGTKSEYIAFLAMLVKELVKSGKSLECAWNAVCNDSKELGHYWNSSDAKDDFEATGNREVCGWCDLANTYKILAEDEEKGNFWLASGCGADDGDAYPLAYIMPYGDREAECGCGTGWLVLT